MGSLWHTLADAFSIVLIDVLLAGDNALVIALAVRSLPAPQRRLGSALGAAAAVILRIAITFLAAQFLNLEFLKLAGGAFILWIAIKVFSDASFQEQELRRKSGGFLRAIWYIMVADLTMSTDNILAVAGASRGSVALIVFGLCLSIPFVVLSSNLLVALLDRFPWLLYLGAAILGKVGAEMMVTDPFVIRTLHPSEIFLYGAEAAAIAGVLIASWIFTAPKRRAEE
ncbi:MAG TPA: TerC family protein [Bryobacteraceae bacterium]|nr:TerC family protein [Bryobacteraceae bacterium]